MQLGMKRINKTNVLHSYFLKATEYFTYLIFSHYVGQTEDPYNYRQHTKISLY